MGITKDNDQLPGWNLDDLYTSIDSPVLGENLAKSEKQCKDFEKEYKGKVKELSAQKLYQSIVQLEKINDLLGKIGSYAFLVYATDQSNTKHSAFYQNISEKINNISQHLIFYTLELNQISEEDLAVKLQDKNLVHYKPWLRDVRIMKPYQLSNEQEQILHQKYITSNQSWVKLFDETQADIRFEFEGKHLTNPEIFQLLVSTDRKIREKAAKAIEQQFVKHGKIFATITNVIAKDKQINDNLRGFPTPISARNVDNFVEDKTVESLINTVKNNYGKLSHRFYKLKAKILNLEYLEYWDRLAPIVQVEEEYIPWEKAKEIVLTAYQKFSPQMAQIAQQFFDNNWIDAAVRPGKYAGAFACPVVPSVHPYVLVNYQGKARDVMTLAHELGHAVHMVLSAKQGALMASTPLTLAETASIFGEQLTFQMLLAQQSDIKVKKSILAHKIDDMLSTVVRQIAFTEYELGVHNERKNGEISIEQLGNIWLESQKASLGPIFNFAENYKYFWQYIPHFIHTPFYVYAYAFADCLVNSLYANYTQKPEGFVEKFIEVLSAGGTEHYNELLQRFGLNAKEGNFWQIGLDIISSYIDEFESLVE
jgi:oligoendopeptidase F